MKSIKKNQFNKTYFQGGKSTYSSCYDYKIGNLKYLFDTEIAGISEKLLNPGDNILDIGCAFGDLLSMFDCHKYHAFGLDISQYALSKARNKTKAELKISDANKKLPFSNNSFKLVTALDIIEHLESPFNFCQEVSRVLKKGGIFCVHTPNINSIFEKIFRKNWFGYKDDTHLYLFNKKNIQFLLEKSGFEIIKNCTISYPLPKFLRYFFKFTEMGGSIWLVARKK